MNVDSDEESQLPGNGSPLHHVIMSTPDRGSSLSPNNSLPDLSSTNSSAGQHFVQLAKCSLCILEILRNLCFKANKLTGSGYFTVLNALGTTAESFVSKV